MRLKNKVTIITGAAHRVGQAYARRFAEEGAHVVVADIDTDGGKRRQRRSSTPAIPPGHGTRCAQFSARSRSDSRNRQKVWPRRRAAEQRRHLRHSAIMEGPGRRTRIGGMGSSHRSELERRVSLQQSGHPGDEAAKKRQIIYIASGSFFSGSGNLPHYTTAKGGVVALTRVMARQLGDWGIDVNCMTPGSTMSEESVSDEILSAAKAARTSAPSAVSKLQPIS